MTAIYQSPLGQIAIDCEDDCLFGLRFAEETVCENARPQDYETTGQQDHEIQAYGPSSALHSVVRWLDEYFSGSVPTVTPRVLLRGTEFQRRVWMELLRIPYGQTVTYAELSHRVGCRSAQAVGQAVGRNPVALVVPCHRVVGSDGSLTGYAYGLTRKRVLLALEAR